MTVAGDGTVATPYTLTPALSADADNLVTCGSAGLLATFSDVTPQAHIKRSATRQSIATATLTAMSFDTEVVDSDTMFDAGAPTRLTFTTAGLYVVMIRADLAGGSGTTGKRVATLRLDGANNVWEVSGTERVVQQGLLTVLRVVAATYAELMIYQNKGSALTVEGELSAFKLPEG